MGMSHVDGGLSGIYQHLLRDRNVLEDQTRDHILSVVINSQVVIK